MSPQYGELRPTSGWDRLTSLGYPCKFQLVLRLCSVTARHLVVDVSQTLRRWTEGATYIRSYWYHRLWPAKILLNLYTKNEMLGTPLLPSGVDQRTKKEWSPMSNSPGMWPALGLTIRNFTPLTLQVELLLSATSVRGGAIWWTLTKERQSICACDKVSICIQRRSNFERFQHIRNSWNVSNTFRWMLISGKVRFFERFYMTKENS